MSLTEKLLKEIEGLSEERKQEVIESNGRNVTNQPSMVQLARK